MLAFLWILFRGVPHHTRILLFRYSQYDWSSLSDFQSAIKHSNKTQPQSQTARAIQAIPPSYMRKKDEKHHQAPIYSDDRAVGVTQPQETFAEVMESYDHLIPHYEYDMEEPCWDECRQSIYVSPKNEDMAITEKRRSPKQVNCSVKKAIPSSLHNKDDTWSGSDSDWVDFEHDNTARSAEIESDESISYSPLVTQHSVSTVSLNQLSPPQQQHSGDQKKQPLQLSNSSQCLLVEKDVGNDQLVSDIFKNTWRMSNVDMARYPTTGLYHTRPTAETDGADHSQQYQNVTYCQFAKEDFQFSIPRTKMVTAYEPVKRNPVTHERLHHVGKCNTQDLHSTKNEFCVQACASAISTTEKTELVEREQSSNRASYYQSKNCNKRTATGFADQQSARDLQQSNSYDNEKDRESYPSLDQKVIMQEKSVSFSVDHTVRSTEVCDVSMYKDIKT